MIFVFLGLFGLVLIVVFAVWLNRREETFEGTVIDKDVRQVVNRNNTYNQNMQPRGGLNINIGGGGIGAPGTFGNTSTVSNDYFVKIQTTNGKHINWQISEGKYEIIKIGDHVTKAKGTTDLEIIPSDQPTSPTSNPPAQPPQPPSTPSTPVPPTTSVTN